MPLGLTTEAFMEKVGPLEENQEAFTIGFVDLPRSAFSC